MNWKTHFYGLGPHIGTRVFFPLVDGFGVMGDLNGSLLMGVTDNEYHKSQSVTGGTVVNLKEIDNFDGDRSVRFVPAAGAMVGVDFTQKFDGDSWGFTLAGGFRGDFYYHVIDNRQLKATEPGLFPHVYPGENRGKFSNFTTVGPFATLGFFG